MNVQAVNFGKRTVNRNRSINSRDLSSYEYEKLLDKKIMELLPKFQDGSADFAVIDTYIGKDGRMKMHAVTRINSEISEDAGSRKFLDDIV